MSLTTKWKKDEGGLPPVVLLPSIQHTGSRFVRWDILKRYEHAQLYENPSEGFCKRTVYYEHMGDSRKSYRFRRLLPLYPTIVPLRHPRRVFKSWIDRGQNVEDCINEWVNLIEIVIPHNPYYLPIDSVDREVYLQKINEDLNVRNDQNWRPRGNNKGTMYLNPEEITLPDNAESFLEGIEWLTEKFWSESVTETDKVKSVVFKNISSKRIEAYGYRWQPEGHPGETSQEVTEQNLIEKFRIYDSLQAVEFVTTKPIKASGEVSRETLKSQAIAAGLKVDGRWSDTRLRKEIDEYMREANGN